ncbi:MAG: hypothetical protein FWD08_08275 [Alphaproteobacteria bacterium]|nr:hypothetical protein [Alphaproteobacteria bacterium]
MSRAAPGMEDEAVRPKNPEAQSKTALLHLTPMHLTSIRVRTDRAEVAAFAGEIGCLGGPDFVPMTFPIRWLTQPDVRQAISQALGPGYLPVHEGQSFAYVKSLKIEHDYELAIRLKLSEKPSRLTLHMRVSDPQGEVCTLETVLRIVPIGMDQRS